MLRRIIASSMASLITGDSSLNVIFYPAELPTHLTLSQSFGKIQQLSSGVYGKEGKADPGSTGSD